MNSNCEVYGRRYQQSRIWPQLKCFERLDKLFQRGRIPNAEQRRRFLVRLRPEIRKLCVVRTFADIEELVGAAFELERVLGELGETPFKPLREEQEEGVAVHGTSGCRFQ
jgi:hypothetical protein